MKKLLYVLFVMVAFVACSDSGIDDGGGNSNNEKPKVPEITLDATAANFATDGGSTIVIFTSSDAWTAEAINNRADAWCSVSPTSGSAGASKITITTTANDTTNDRTATIVIKSGTAQKSIAVSQKQKDALTVTSSKFEVSADGEDIEIEVKANIDFNVEIEESAKSWVTHRSTRAMKSSTLIIEVDENDGSEKRKANISITGGGLKETITIYQESNKPSIVISQNEYVVSSNGETIAVDVASNVNVTVELPTEIDWISENTPRAMSTNTYRFDIEQNEDYDQRSAEIRFTNKENNLTEVVKVVQVQKDALVVAKDSYILKSDGGQIPIEVGYNIDFDIEISADWITKVDTRTFVTETLIFDVAKNTNYESREGTIIFKSKDGIISQTVKIHQTQKDVIVLAKDSYSLGYIEENIEIKVGHNVDFNIEISDNWITKVDTRKYTTDTLIFNIAENTSGIEREGSIIFTSIDGTVKQIVKVCQKKSGAIVEWIDQRLQDEYYWLDEYKAKLNTFDYSLDYDKFLSTSLLSMTTNMEDGYVSGGTRYLYSYITRESTTRAADNRMENSFGILIASRYFGGSNNTAILVVEHVYPNSPAANAGLKRGDTITKVDNATIPSPSASLQQFYSIRNKLEYGTGSMTIEGERMDRKSGRYLTYRHSLTSADYDPSPVAHYTVLEFDEAVAKVINPDGKKIGYLSYLGFESEYDAELIEAMEYLAAKGITDLILDLRVNGGGSVNTSTMLGSMLLSESYVGKTYATLKRNPKNKLFPAEYLNDDCLITKNGLGDEFENNDLPNLDLPELWVIASNSTASASEMVIKGLEGLDVPVHIVGKTTNGKNCGMDVMEKTFGEYKYTFAPITFMNFNAKGDNDYADGIKPQVNFDDYWNESNIQSSYQTYQCYVFPMPMNEWAELNFTPSENGGYNFSGDFALYETVLRICGHTMLSSTSSLSQVNIKPAEMATTRAMQAREVYDAGFVPTRRAYGATLTETDRIELRNKQ